MKMVSVSLSEISSNDNQVQEVLNIFNKYKNKFIYGYEIQMPEVNLFDSTSIISPKTKINSLASFSCHVDDKTNKVKNPKFNIDKYCFLSNILLEKCVLYCMCSESSITEYGNLNDPKSKSHWKLAAQNVGLVPPNRTVTVKQVLSPNELQNFLNKINKQIENNKNDTDVKEAGSNYLNKQGNIVRFYENYKSKGKILSSWVYGRVIGTKGSVVEMLCYNPRKELIYGYGTKNIVYLPSSSSEDTNVKQILNDKVFNSFLEYLDTQRNPAKTNFEEKMKINENFNKSAKQSLAKGKQIKLSIN